MGGVSVGGGHGGKKSLDAEIPLVPFIDLLLCCIMFLLATAVWNQLARLAANQKQPGTPQTVDQPPPEKVKLIVQLRKNGHVLASTDGANSEEVPKVGSGEAANYDLVKLAQQLDQRRQQDPERHDITVSPEDGVLYKDVIKIMDLVVGKDFRDVDLNDGQSL